MNQGDGQRFGMEILKLSEAFNAPVSEARASVFFESLADLSIERVVEACRRARQTLEFFPSPGKLRALAEGVPQDHAEVAWIRFLTAVRHVGSYQSVDFDDEVLHETIRALWGGWATVAESFTMDEEPYRHAEFLKTYRALASRDLGVATPLLGRLAIENGARGLTGYIPAPIRVLNPAPRTSPKELTP